MKITFEGISIYDVAEQMVGFLDGMETGKSPIAVAAPEPAPAPPVQKSKGGRPKGFKVKPKGKPVEKTVEKIVEKAAKKSVMPPSAMQDEKAMQTEKFEDMVLEPDLTDAPEPVIDMTKLTALRVKTTEDLQAAYSNGKHKQVLELLSTYGNGAKSFRELAIKDFIPIRKAIDDGALQ